ncbi:MAG: VOC family protein [Oscillatoriales cyanobacterium]|nr:MAG: VOC family protein [Oscillatoriales cyanobacterium]
MFDHLSLGVTDFAASVAFYDAVLDPLGVRRWFVMDQAAVAAYQDAGGESFWLYGNSTLQIPLIMIEPTDRFHVAFRAVNRLAVNRFYQAAIAQGGQDAGMPGLRPQYHPHYYAAYVLDPDGYKIEAVCHQPG